MVRPDIYRMDRRLSINMPPDNMAHEHGIFEDIDSTPKIVGGMVLGAVAMLVLLKTAGFRFTFSANVGAK